MNTNVAENNYGYIYCMSNKGLKDNYFKVGFSKNDPSTTAKQLYTTSAVEPFVVEFAKKVIDPQEKEKIVFYLLGENGYRINSKREFFNCDINEIHNVFVAIKGTWYEPAEDNVEEVEEEEEEEVKVVEIIKKSKYNRIMQDVFHDGQLILHEVKGNQWIGTYNKENNFIVFNDTKYNSLNKFTNCHYQITSPYRTPENNAWAESFCMIDNVWVSTYDLPLLSVVN